VGADEDLTLLLRAHAHARVSVDRLQEQCELTIEHEGRRLASQPFLLDMADFTGDLDDKANPTNGSDLNLYVLGAQGAGKGSFINTILTLLSDDDHLVTYADVGGDADHNTTSLER
jgi:hypothetical protein